MCSCVYCNIFIVSDSFLCSDFSLKKATQLNEQWCLHLIVSGLFLLSFFDCSTITKSGCFVDISLLRTITVDFDHRDQRNWSEFRPA